jgi:diguanylate cyclase (GGDEF)-like protein
MPLSLSRWLLAWALALGGLLACAAARADTALVLDERGPERPVWSLVTMLVDPSQALDLDAVRARDAEFRPPEGPEANLGPRSEAIWLRLDVVVANGDGRWVLDIDYPPLNRVDLYQISDGLQVAEHRMGSAQPYDARPMPGRAHAVQLELPPGQRHTLYLRVHTHSALVLPITLSKADVFHAREDSRQLVQGLVNGLSLALLAYSLAHGLSLRKPLFGLYALMLLGTTAFFLDFFGIAQQYLWSERSGLAARVAPMSVLIGVAAGALFVTHALDTAGHSPRIHRALRALSATAALAIAATLVGVLSYRGAQTTTALIGPLLPLLAIPPAWARCRRGELAGVYMLLGWGAYLVGAVAMVSVLRGWIPANFTTLHLFQWGAMVEMLAWQRVLALHIETVRRHAERTELERETLVSLAHTDALTGLPNRRGLSQALARALPLARPDSALALYLLDLDGFKPVNDRLGHDAGDELLVQVGERLRHQVRHSDVVARLGGDEFVIMTAGLPGEAEALALGRKLLDAFREPFVVAGQDCRVGITIGFALAPHDGSDGTELLKRADAAMYVGKQAGRHTLRRGSATALLVDA